MLARREPSEVEGTPFLPDLFFPRLRAHLPDGAEPPAPIVRPRVVLRAFHHKLRIRSTG
ncbi:MAG: hypothetical protein J0I07_05300 [Myxococcales bacterium]|mgnify:FL=1|nr:hypothetical protein [Myxococcales bacterium]